MAEATFENQVLTKLEHLEKAVSFITEYIEDSRLSNGDKEDLRQALQEEKEGSLLSKKQVFG